MHPAAPETGWEIKVAAAGVTFGVLCFLMTTKDDTEVMAIAQTPRHGYSWGSKVSAAAGAAIID